MTSQQQQPLYLFLIGVLPEADLYIPFILGQIVLETKVFRYISNFPNMHFHVYSFFSHLVIENKEDIAGNSLITLLFVGCCVFIVISG